MLHVDLDQFLAAVEVLRNPQLRGKPVVVGGDGDPAKRGVVSTASYEAREFGVHSGLPLRTAAKRCPDCVFLPIDADSYNKVSERVMTVLRETGDPVEVLGWDEAFVGAETDDPEQYARGLIADVKTATDLDCSVGIGDNKLQAKIATSFGKPAGVGRLTTATWFPVLGDRPPDAIWGIGAKTTAKLAALGITTVRQLADADPQRLAGEFGPTTGPWLVLLGNGIGEREVDPTPYVPRSHGREVTFQRNLRLGGGGRAGSPAGQAGRRRGHGPPGGPGGGEGALRPVHHDHPRHPAAEGGGMAPGNAAAPGGTPVPRRPARARRAGGSGRAGGRAR